MVNEDVAKPIHEQKKEPFERMLSDKDVDKRKTKMLKTMLENEVSHTNALRAVRMKMAVHGQEDKESDWFHPSWIYYFYGDLQVIYGYSDAIIELRYSPASLHYNIKRTSGVKQQLTKKKIKEIDETYNFDNNPEDILALKMPGTPSNEQEFIQILEKEDEFVPYGNVVVSFPGESVMAESDPPKQSEFQIRHFTLAELSEARDWVERMESFCLFFIDGANVIDVKEPEWEFFTIYEKYEVESVEKFAFVGFVNLYSYLSFAEGKDLSDSTIRKRISQVVVLPKYQRRGYCLRLVDTIFNTYRNAENLLEITIEDGIPEFEVIYNRVCTWNIHKDEEFFKTIIQNEASIPEKDVLLGIRKKIKFPLNVIKENIGHAYLAYLHKQGKVDAMNELIAKTIKTKIEGDAELIRKSQQRIAKSMYSIYDSEEWKIVKIKMKDDLNDSMDLIKKRFQAAEETTRENYSKVLKLITGLLIGYDKLGLQW